jgi:hypothetical protein
VIPVAAMLLCGRRKCSCWWSSPIDRSVIMITGSQAWFRLRLQNQCSFSYIWIISFTAFQFNQMRVVDFQRQ